MKAYYLILSGIYWAARSRVFWAVVILAVAWWLWWGKSLQRDTDAAEAFITEAVLEREAPAVHVSTEAMGDKPAAAAGDKPKRTAEDEPLFFSPGYTEAVVGRFHQQTGRLPANWKELKDSGLVDNVPDPRPGHKISYNPTLGMIEEVPDSEAGR